MKEERKVIEPNAIVVFDQDIYASKLKSVLEDFQGDVVIHGDLTINDDFHVKCNLYVIGDIRCQSSCSINIEGDLFCYGIIDCFDIYVSGCFYCDTSIDCIDIKVGENFLCEDKITSNCSDVIVAGDFECYSIETGKIQVLGQMRVKNEIAAKKVEVGY